MKLTPRELQIVTCLQQGQTNKQIGQVLGVSHHTVRDAISPLFVRFEVKSRTALAAALTNSHQRQSTNPNISAAKGPAAPGRRATDRRASGERRAAMRQLPQH